MGWKKKVTVCSLVIIQILFLFLLQQNPQPTGQVSQLLSPINISINVSSVKSKRDGDADLIADKVNKLCKALWDADFKIMSLILKNRLYDIILQNYNSTGFTVFVPIDEAVYNNGHRRLIRHISLEHQVATSKVYEHDFDNLSIPRDNGWFPSVIFFNSCQNNETLHVTKLTHQDGYTSINDKRIIHWNLYNDGDLIAHGVDDFFDCGWPFNKLLSGFWI